METERKVPEGPGHVESRCGKLKELQGVQDSSVYKGRKIDASAKETEGYW